ncbi:MAG: 30S ribosomal protein S8 [Candidatus Kerfeldbacteria bacterium]|nr:30S ribosomal protein S8 [Candidatus Kerfeldbacteria bacterium]
MTDPIADMLTRIRNAQAVRKTVVLLPSSKLKRHLALILKQEGYLSDVVNETVAGKPTLTLTLKYAADGSCVIRSLKRISKPGRRIYSQKKMLPHVLNNMGIAIISTSQGLMTNREARQKNIGGEIICEVY